MNKKIFKLLFVALIGLILITEIIFRTALHEQLKTQNIPSFYQPDTISDFSFIPNSEGCFIGPGVYKCIRINNKGFIGKDIPENKRNTMYRILMVGASNVAGTNMSEEGDMCQMLNDNFKTSHDSVEVYNCALVGAGRDYGLYRMIKFRLKELSPDLVLFNCNIPFKARSRIRESYNDYLIDYPEINKDNGRKIALSKIEKINNAKLLTFMYDKSYIVRAIARHIFYHDKCSVEFRNLLWLYVTKKNTHYRNFLDLSISTTSTINLLKDFDSLNFDVSLFDYYNITDYKNICSDNGIPLISLNCKFSDEYKQKFDGHMNGKGHKLVADSLYAYLSNNYIPTKFINQEK